MSEFAAGFRTQDLRTALQVRHTIFTLREKIKTWQNLIRKSLKNEDILQFLSSPHSTTMHGDSNGGGTEGYPSTLAGSKETKANVSCQKVP